MMIFNTQVFNENIDVKLLNKKNNRHTYLRIKNEKLIEISSNIYFTISDAKRLINEKKEWIESRIKFLKTESLKKDEYLFLGKRLKKDSTIKKLDEFYKNKSKEINGSSPLHYAVQRSNVVAVNELLTRNDIDIEVSAGSFLFFFNKTVVNSENV